ncbi:hypothetical protein SSBR45G_01620 [Bradyrhizobium sp. SSBR45G]|nr:hypothetical protein SSBR45G_01620 [Bradyrhizobium sp. SSBR45G]GLH82959.1 hypothetical protein SSBR45R_04190 [Bradyrhizobium sp. SSBR45R]
MSRQKRRITPSANPPYALRKDLSDVKRALRRLGWIYLTGVVVVAVALLTFRYWSGMHGSLLVGIAAHDLVLAVLWPVFVVAVVLAILGYGNVE